MKKLMIKWMNYSYVKRKLDYRRADPCQAVIGDEKTRNASHNVKIKSQTA